MTFQTFTGKQYLMIDIANNFGEDKEDWDVRLDWFQKNESNLENLIKQAEEPALFYAGVQAWRKVQKGQPTGYPVSLDATSSGIQILACLTGDRKAAELCNVVDTGHREDAYTGLYEAMCEKIGEEAKINRKDCKSSIMTAFYGSTAEPKRVFGEGALLNIFNETMIENAPAAWELNQFMLDIWNPEAYSNDWIMPDNFHVHVKVMSQVTETVRFLNEPFDVNYQVNQPMEKGRSLGANMTHSIDGMLVREMGRRCMYDIERINLLKQEIPQKNYWGKDLITEADKMVKTLWDHYEDSKFLSARILDYIAPWNGGHITDMSVIMELIESLPAKPFEILSVHDCFRCLPNYANDLRKQYNILLSNIAKSEMLSFIVSQMMKRIVTIGKVDPHLWKDILDSNYSLS